MELGHQTPSLLIDATTPITSNVSLIDECDRPAVRRKADPFSIECCSERRVGNGRNNNTLEDLAYAAILHRTRFRPAAIRFLRSLFLLWCLCTQQRRGANAKKNDGLSPHRFSARSLKDRRTKARLGQLTRGQS